MPGPFDSNQNPEQNGEVQTNVQMPTQQSDGGIPAHTGQTVAAATQEAQVGQTMPDATQGTQAEQAIPGASQGAQPAQAPVQQASTSGLAIAGMVLGIIALVTIPLPVINFGSPVLGIVGLILSIVGLSGIKKGKHKGRGIAIAGIVLCAIVTVLALLVSVACSAAMTSRSSSSSSPTVAASSSAAASSAVAQNSESADVDGKAFIGTWDMTKLTMKNETYDERALQEAREKGVDSFLVINDDGTSVLVFADYRNDSTWEATSSASGIIRNDNGTMTVTLNNDVLSLKDASNLMEFKRGEARATIPPASSNNSASKEASTVSSAKSGEVSPDLKEALDSYEAFVDEYVEFMQRYKESGSTSEMLTDYMEYMQRYTDFAAKIEKLDTKNMSKADYDYYIDVTTRVSKKLLDVSGI